MVATEVHVHHEDYSSGCKILVIDFTDTGGKPTSVLVSDRIARDLRDQLSHMLGEA
jgi:hypothetical protein